MSQSPIRVLIAGGGVAGLEALAALRALAGRQVELALVAPEDEFIYRPLAVEEPFAVGRIRRIPLHDAARDAAAAFFAGTIKAVNPEERTVSTSDRRTLEYDALVLAVGATAEPAMAHATTWDDRADVELLAGLLQDFEHGYSRRLAVVIPPGPSWSLRAYELALLITLEGKSMGVDVDTTIVTPEPSPLTILGSRAVELVARGARARWNLRRVRCPRQRRAGSFRRGRSAAVWAPLGHQPRHRAPRTARPPDRRHTRRRAGVHRGRRALPRARPRRRVGDR